MTQNITTGYPSNVIVNKNLSLNMYQKLVNAKRAFSKIVKNVKGYGYQYADLAQTIESIQPHLWDNGLDYYQTIKDNKMITGILDCETGTKEDLVEFTIISANIAKASEIQQFGGGITYLRRYSLQVAFNLASEDIDGYKINNIISQSSKINKLESAECPTKEEIKNLYEIKKKQLSFPEDVLAKLEDYFNGKINLELQKVYEYLKKA